MVSYSGSLREDAFFNEAGNPLRFSKSGNPEIEKAYATHYVDLGRAEQLKKEKMEKAAAIRAGRLGKTSGMPEMNISENNNG